MIKNILLATDLSANTDKVAKKAKSIAEKYNAKLSIIHVLEYRHFVYSNSEFSIPIDVETLNSIEDHAKKALQKLGKKIDVAEEHQYIADIAESSIKESIVNLAEKLKADLIVIGSHGKHGPELLLGSTANAILHVAKCNVLAVRI